MGDPGTIPTAKERIDAVLAGRDPSVLSLADVEDLMERHLAANTEALELFARWAERERDEARAQAEHYAAGWESLADELPEWQHQHVDGETEEQSILERVITTVAEWRREKARREKTEASIAELKRERDEARARVAELAAKSHTYCAYCGHREEIDPDALGITQHIAQCKKHPMRRVERERDTAREIVEKMEAERYVTLQRLDELVRERDEALARVAELESLLQDVVRDTGIEYRDNQWPALVAADWFQRRQAALGKEAQP